LGRTRGGQNHEDYWGIFKIGTFYRKKAKKPRNLEKPKIRNPFLRGSLNLEGTKVGQKIPLSLGKKSAPILEEIPENNLAKAQKSAGGSQLVCK